MYRLRRASIRTSRSSGATAISSGPWSIYISSLRDGLRIFTGKKSINRLSLIENLNTNADEALFLASSICQRLLEDRSLTVLNKGCENFI